MLSSAIFYELVATADRIDHLHPYTAARKSSQGPVLMQAMFNYSMWFYWIRQHSLYCLSRLAQLACSAAQRQGMPSTLLCVPRAAQNKLLLLTHIPPSLPPREGARHCSGERLPWNPHPQFKPGLTLAFSSTRRSQLGIFLSVLWDSYTPTKNLSPFIHSSSSLQGCGAK